MDVVTYVVDAPTLVNNINAIKQWVYSESICILIPLSVLCQVEEQYHISIAPKEPVKEHHVRKSWGKVPRKEHPLFDINPRIAWEFLLRAKAGKGEFGVKFQQEEEKFTHWEGRQENAKPESPPPPPTSFASALLSKLNVQESSETNGVKGPTKPKLVARSGDSKTQWSYHKVPTISDNNLPPAIKPVLSCVLWRIHEFQQNQLEPEIFALLSDDSVARDIAAGMSIMNKTSLELRHIISKAERVTDLREESGQLELDFPRPTNGNISNGPDAQVTQTTTTNGHTAVPAYEKARVSQPLSALRETFESQKNVTHPREPLRGFQPFGLPPSPKPSMPPHAHPEKPLIQAPIGTGRLKVPREMMSPPNEKEIGARTGSLLDSLMQGSSPDVPEENNAKQNDRPKSISPIEERKQVDEESEIDSDEEVIVFNPRARRTSGRPKTPVGPPKSRPTTSHGHSASTEGLKPARSPMVSTLKPQSPVFTPGQAYVPVAPAMQDQHAQAVAAVQPPKPAYVQPPTKPAQDRTVNVSPPAISSPGRSPQPRSATPRRPRADLPTQRLPSHDHLQQQHQSRMIIQRQREAIERHVKAAAKPTPKPREIQMEPTENPTVIDPDAFDRSYVVQHPGASSAVTNGKPGSGTRGARRRSPKGKESPKQSIRKPSEKPPAAEADVDFVLKSGQPRGSMRGKGKLWVP